MIIREEGLVDIFTPQPRVTNVPETAVRDVEPAEVTADKLYSLGRVTTLEVHIPDQVNNTIKGSKEAA